MVPRKLTMGKDAQVSYLAKFLHPSEYICTAFPNTCKEVSVKNLVVVSKEMKKIWHKEQMAIVFQF